jgi:hypothetical protein
VRIQLAGFLRMAAQWLDGSPQLANA